MKIDGDWFPIVALVLGVFVGALAIFIPTDVERIEAIAFATNLITMAGTAFGLRAKYGHYDEDL
jgi:hypothetical protein